MKKRILPFLAFPLLLGGCGFIRIPDFIKTKILHQEDTDISMVQFMKLSDTIKSYTLDLNFDGVEYDGMPAVVNYHVEFVKNNNPYKEISINGNGHISKKFTKLQIFNLITGRGVDEEFPEIEGFDFEGTLESVTDEQINEEISKISNLEMTKDGDLYVLTYTIEISPSYLKVAKVADGYETIDQKNNEEGFNLVPCDFFLSLDDVFANFLKYSYPLLKYDSSQKCYSLRSGIVDGVAGYVGLDGYEFDGDIYFKDNVFDRIVGSIVVEGMNLTFDGKFSNINSTTIVK